MDCFPCNCPILQAPSKLQFARVSLVHIKFRRIFFLALKPRKIGRSRGKRDKLTVNGIINNVIIIIEIKIT